MARLSLTLLLLLSLLSLSLARFQPQPQSDVIQSQPSDFHLPQLPHPEPDSESSALPQLPNPEIEQDREIQLPELPELEKPEEKPEPDTVQYIVVPVRQFRDVRSFDGLQGIGFSLRLPMRHGGRRHGHRRFGHGFGHRFRHGMSRGFEGREDRMEGDEEEERRVVEMPEIPRPVHMKEKMEMDRPAWNYDFTSMPMEDEEKMERVKEFIKKMRKCKHHQHLHHRDNNNDMMMMHRHHEHHHGQPREEPPREEPPREEGGFMKQVMNLFNF